MLDSHTIEGSWRAVTVAGQTVVDGHEPTATFLAGEVTGTTGCNSYGGSYRYEEGALTIGEMRTTMMACIGPIGDVESRFTEAMSGATTAAVDGDGRLVVEGTSGSVVFVPISE
ncbi:MAG: META domain-containing protein [Chloroflexota bacterium]|jgi:heat shock protein HslJ